MDVTFPETFACWKKSQSQKYGVLLLPDKWTLTTVFKRALGVSAPLFKGGGEAVRSTDQRADGRPSSSWRSVHVCCSLSNTVSLLHALKLEGTSQSSALPSRTQFSHWIICFFKLLQKDLSGLQQPNCSWHCGDTLLLNVSPSIVYFQFMAGSWRKCKRLKRFCVKKNWHINKSTIVSLISLLAYMQLMDLIHITSVSNQKSSVLYR